MHDVAFDTTENQEEKLGLRSIIFPSLEDELGSSMNPVDTAQPLPQYVNRQTIHILITQTDIVREKRIHYFF